MPTHNPLVAAVPMVSANPAGGSVRRSGGAGATSAVSFQVGPIHLSVIGLVLVSAIGLVLLHRAGFRFSLAVGRG